MVAESPGTILMLPPECLETIIKMCPLKDQIQLAKVCQQFYHILQRIWSIRYYSFTYSILELKYKQDWNELEIRDACMLFGRHVRILCFCTMFRSDMLVEIQRYDGWNPIERLKRYLNLNFISNLKYFENVEEFEIRGKLINDFVIEALAYKCKHLRSVKFLNGTTQSCVGSFLHKLTNLHTLEIPASRNIGPASLMLCSEKNPLRYLNIVECKLLEDVPIMISLCHYWRNITTLRLTAFSSSYEYIAAIFNLNTLKDLQMYWTKNPFEDFVESFLHQLQLHDEKCMKLQLISFETDRYNIEDTSNVDWTPFTYARMRELVCINGTPWVWSPEFLALLTPYFRSFANLKELHFVYARLLPYELLKQIPVINRNIQLILVQGCPYKCDQLFAREWERIFPKCHLRFQSVLNAHQAEVSDFSYTILTLLLLLFSFDLFPVAIARQCT